MRHVQRRRGDTFCGGAAAWTADVMSISNSILSLLFGQALDQVKIDSLDHRMADYFPEYFSSSSDARKRQITLRHMLTNSRFRLDRKSTRLNSSHLGISY